MLPIREDRPGAGGGQRCAAAQRGRGSRAHPGPGHGAPRRGARKNFLTWSSRQRYPPNRAS